nr:hypothetical protein [Tanacetum cinerariifolium]GFB25673.1 hypothetical protein [Tanacetum cinerariifolium]
MFMGISLRVRMHAVILDLDLDIIILYVTLRSCVTTLMLKILKDLLTISPSICTLPLDRFDNNVSFEEEVVHHRLRKTLTHVLELSSCVYLDDRAWGVLNFDSARVDNTVRVNQIVTIFLIESSIHILDQDRYPVDTSLIQIESRKSPTTELFDVDSGRISIRHCEY